MLNSKGPLIRFVTHVEWALENRPRVNDLLEYEARANDIWLRQDGPVKPVICTYDLSKFGGEINCFAMAAPEGESAKTDVGVRTDRVEALDSRDLKYPKVSASKLKELAAAKRTL